MLAQVKLITFSTFILFMVLSFSAQQIDTVVYIELDSIQDARLEILEQQLNTVNSMLLKTSREQQETAD